MTTISLDQMFKAQFGEDRILWQVFEHRPRGYFIEVGAYDGVTISNTYFLERMGWSGVLIEPIPEACQRAADERPRSRVIHAAASKRGSCGTATFTVTRNAPVLSFLKRDEQHVERCIREGCFFEEIEVPVLTIDDVLLNERQHAPPDRSPWSPEGGWRIDFTRGGGVPGEQESRKQPESSQYRPSRWKSTTRSGLTVMKSILRIGSKSNSR